jgi:signal transduction histidine kinase
MRLRHSRTAIAALLTATGVIVPCTAWYVVGSRAAGERAARMEEAPRIQARQAASRLARQVALRLESMRSSESHRPFQDYLSSDRLQELQRDCSYEITIPSPLAEGPVDPLIWAHFQIDAVGLLTLPTLANTVTGTGARDAAAIQHAILSELECASSDHLAALHRTVEHDERRELPSPQGLITVGPFSWHAATIAGSAALVALREVATPSEVLTQGFVVPTDRLDSLLDGALYPAQIRSGNPQTDDDVLVPIQGDPWTLRLTATQAVAVAEAEARRVEQRFRRNFLVGAIAALIAGAALVLLVWQTDRIAVERSRFAASAAHELRTPLAGIQLYGEMLAEGSGDPTRKRLYARRVADEAERLARVVTNVMGFSRLERDGLVVNPQVGDLEPAVRSSVERLRPALESAGVPIDLDIQGPLPQASFDPDALHQILQNLLDNSSKFNRDARDRTVHVRLSAPGNHPTLEVLDHGSGVARKVRRRLFRPFAHHPDPGAPSGLGIGLAIVRALAEAQGAEISYRDVAEGGAAFSVRFARAA